MFPQCSAVLHPGHAPRRFHAALGRRSTIGLEFIKRQLTVGNNYYIPINTATQAEAREWVAEQEARLAKEKDAARAIEAKRFQSIRGWTIAA